MKYFLSLLLYRIVLLILAPVILSFLLIKSWKNPAFRFRLTERLGLVPRSLRSAGIIVHASSVGEVIALKPAVMVIGIHRTPISRHSIVRMAHIAGPEHLFFFVRYRVVR